MRDVYVAGVGMTKFAKTDLHFRQMGQRAVIDAIKDAGIDKSLIEAGYAGHARTGKMWNFECGVGQAILWDVGINEIPILSVGNYCSSGSTAIREAWIAVGAGLYDCVIAVGVEKLSGRAEKGKPLTSDGVELETHIGFTPPAHFAMSAYRYMHLYGATKEQIAMVSVKNRKNGALNPKSQYQKAVSLEQVLEAKSIVDPLTLYQCAPISDGASAAIICSKSFYDKHVSNKPVKLEWCSLKSGTYSGSKRDIVDDGATVLASQDAYEKSGIDPKEIDVAEVHDCFTIAEILHYEGLGFCEKGMGAARLEEGKFNINGDVAVNPSGGLISKGHPLGATGVGQLYEITMQLRGLAGPRQHQNAKVGMTHTAGGFKEADSASISVNILTV